MQFSCYIEVNLISLILLGIIYFRLYQRRTMMSTAQKTLKHMLAASALLCLADIVAIISRGRFFPGARVVIEASNIIYLDTMPLIAMFWCDYVFVRLGKKLESYHLWLYRLPFIFFTLVVLFNPLHHLLFSIDANNLYVRGPGVFIHWLVSWFYFIQSGALAFNAIRKSSSWTQRNEYRPLLYFLIMPAVGCITQMLFYGVTSVQAGIILSLILVSMQMQDNQISTDELTGINNRKAMRHYLDNMLHSGAPVTLTVIMIDVNHFKQINDTYGHAVGDVALCDTASILRRACSYSHDHLFLCRYGGDEFVIIGRNTAPDTPSNLIAHVRQALSELSSTTSNPFTLGLSFGCATGECTSYEDFMHYLRLADETMYDNKKRQK